MAELFMECEEEELEPWQQKVEESQSKDDDDELIFVGEISSSKPAISNILNRCSPGSSSKGLKNGSFNPAISNIFKPTSQHYRNPSSNALVALPSFHPALKSSESSDGQTVSKLDFTNWLPRGRVAVLLRLRGRRRAAPRDRTSTRCCCPPTTNGRTCRSSCGCW